MREESQLSQLGLSENHIRLLQQTFLANPRIERVKVFGSRATGTFQKYSDIDLAVYGDLDFFELSALHGILDELPMVYKFDVVGYQDLKHAPLKQHIDRVGVVLFEREPAV